MSILEILEDHLRVKGVRGLETLCICGWHTAQRLRPEDLHRAHLAEVLEKHMQEREAKAWEKGEGAGNHNTVQRLRMIQRTSHEPLITNPYADEEPSNGR